MNDQAAINAIEANAMIIRQADFDSPADAIKAAMDLAAAGATNIVIR